MGANVFPENGVTYDAANYQSFMSSWIVSPFAQFVTREPSITMSGGTIRLDSLVMYDFLGSRVINAGKSSVRKENAGGATVYYNSSSDSISLGGGEIKIATVSVDGRVTSLLPKWIGGNHWEGVSSSPDFSGERYVGWYHTPGAPLRRIENDRLVEYKEDSVFLSSPTRVYTDDKGQASFTVAGVNKNDILSASVYITKLYEYDQRTLWRVSDIVEASAGVTVSVCCTLLETGKGFKDNITLSVLFNLRRSVPS